MKVFRHDIPKYTGTWRCTQGGYDVTLEFVKGAAEIDDAEYEKVKPLLIDYNGFSEIPHPWAVETKPLKKKAPAKKPAAKKAPAKKK